MNEFNPILLDIAESFDTDRLIIQAVKPGDGALHFPALVESIKDLRLYLAELPWVKVEPSLANSELFCRESYSRFIKRQDLGFFMLAKTDKRLIGSIGLYRVDWNVPKFEIGYWCRTSAQGNGFVAEAVREITQFAFSQLSAKRIEIRADALNVASWRVAENSGFELEGVLRNAYRDGVSKQLGDLRIYAKIAP